MGKALVKKILVCVNASSESIRAAMYAILLSKQFGFSVKALYVIDTATIKFLSNSKFLSSDESNLYESKFSQDGKHYLEYVKNLARSKGIKIDTEIRSGNVSSEILAAAEDFNADMILVGGKKKKNQISTIRENPHAFSRAWSTVGNLLMDNASCPVLVVNKEGMENLFEIS